MSFRRTNLVFYDQKSDLWGPKPGCRQGSSSIDGSVVTLSFLEANHLPWMAISYKSIVVDQVLPLCYSCFFLLSFPFNDPLIHLALQDSPEYSSYFKIKLLATWIWPKLQFSLTLQQWQAGYWNMASLVDRYRCLTKVKCVHPKTRAPVA